MTPILHMPSEGLPVAIITGLLWDFWVVGKPLGLQIFPSVTYYSQCRPIRTPMKLEKAVIHLAQVLGSRVEAPHNSRKYFLPDADIQGLAHQRQEAQQSRNFAEADRICQMLQQ